MFGIAQNLRFALAVGDADRVVIRDGGFCHGNPDREPSLLVLTDQAEIAAFNLMFRFTGSRPPCMCCDYPAVYWRKGDRRIVKSAMYDCQSGGKYTLSFDDNGTPRVKCDIPGHEWSFRTGWGEK